MEKKVVLDRTATMQKATGVLRAGSPFLSGLEYIGQDLSRLQLEWNSRQEPLTQQGYRAVDKTGVSLRV